ncbi:MAG: hypothetical protein KatS3mg076_1091 [Candidatus Binatia bacterium]|nr:MAG: hypothetical protein KatS3mg076_1091 [Candidatus Binatia bacterium]
MDASRDGLLRAAVLVPLFRKDGKPWVLLTRRSQNLPNHAGQVAFPGGRFDPNLDSSLLETALREAREEIALPASRVAVMGALPDVETLSSRFVITPFVARVPEDHPYRPCDREVAEIFSMPLSLYWDPAHRDELEWHHEGQKVRTPALRYGHRLIWGATLRVLDLLVRSPLLDRALRP